LCKNYNFVKIDTEICDINISGKKIKSSHTISQSEEIQMSTQQQARALMMRHHQMIKNRQQSMLERAAEEIGVEVDATYWSNIQGKPHSSFRTSYDRSNASLS
jgi:hypothetical protein